MVEEIITYSPTVYFVRDSHGNEACGVVEDTCNTVQVCGLKTKIGEDIYFESEFYHLITWAAEHGLELYRKTVPMQIPLNTMAKVAG